MDGSIEFCLCLDKNRKPLMVISLERFVWGSSPLRIYVDDTFSYVTTSTVVIHLDSSLGHTVYHWNYRRRAIVDRIVTPSLRLVNRPIINHNLSDLR